jgi:hypothetical protein
MNKGDDAVFWEFHMKLKRKDVKTLLSIWIFERNVVIQDMKLNFTQFNQKILEKLLVFVIMLMKQINIIQRLSIAIIT